MNKNNYILGENEILEIKSDRLFHDMFNEHEMDTIEWAVMQILDKTYEEIHGNVRVGNIRLTNISKSDKQKFVDLVVYLSDKIIVIELNNNYEGNYLRNVLYSMNVINNSYIEGDEYGNKKVQGILVNLNWHKSEKKYSRYEIEYAYPKECEENRDYLLKIININLAFYENKSYNKFKGVDKLSKLFTINDRKELETFTNEEKMLNDYYNKMDRLSRDEEYCRMIWDERIERNLRKAEEYYNGEQAGIRQGIKEGIEKGISEGKKEIVINMYNKNMSLDIISECVNLSFDEVDRIIKSKKSNNEIKEIIDNSVI